MLCLVQYSKNHFVVSLKNTCLTSNVFLYAIANKPMDLVGSWVCGWGSTHIGEIFDKTIHL